MIHFITNNVNNGDLSTAQTVASSVPGTGDDNVDFASLWSILYDLKSNNHTWRNLNNTQKQTLNTLSSNRTQAAYSAQSILETTYGNDYSPILETISQQSNKNGQAKNIEPNSSTNIQVYPNPVENILTISLNEQERQFSHKIVLFNLLGHQNGVWDFDTSLSELKIDLRHQANGIYLLSLENNQGAKQSFKIIK